MPAAMAGGAAGIVNGFFGGGGGMVLVPLLMSRCGWTVGGPLPTPWPSSFPLCALSAVIYYVRGHLDVLQSLPYLIGVDRRPHRRESFSEVPVVWLKRAFALLILYGAWRALVG